MSYYVILFHMSGHGICYSLCNLISYVMSYFRLYPSICHVMWNVNVMSCIMSSHKINMLSLVICNCITQYISCHFLFRPYAVCDVMQYIMLCYVSYYVMSHVICHILSHIMLLLCNVISYAMPHFM